MDWIKQMGFNLCLGLRMRWGIAIWIPCEVVTWRSECCRDQLRRFSPVGGGVSLTAAALNRSQDRHVTR